MSAMLFMTPVLITKHYHFCEHFMICLAPERAFASFLLMFTQLTYFLSAQSSRPPEKNCCDVAIAPDQASVQTEIIVP